MRVLVTGVNGFIGSHAAERLQELGHEVVGFARTVPEIKVNRLVLGDLTDRQLTEKLLQEPGIDCIHHVAANADTWDLGAGLLDANILGTWRLLEAARKWDARFVYSSSSAVYGDLLAPHREDLVPQPTNNYALSKLASEKMVEAYVRDYGLRACALRYFNTYGIREHRKGKTASMVYHFLAGALNGKVSIYGDGKQKRDFICVRDTVVAHEKAMEFVQNSKQFHVFNVGSGKATEFNVLVQTIGKVLGKKVEVTHTPNPIRAGYQLHTEADMTKARELLGFVPAITLEEGVRWMAEYYAPKIKAENK